MSGVTFRLDEATPMLERVQSAAAQRGLALVGGRAVATLVRTHLVNLNASRHKFGRNYYAQAARSTHVRAVVGGAAVSITQVGFRQRLLGGPIRPGAGKKFITIPAIPEAYGTRAGEWTGLKVAKAYDPKRGYLRWALVRVTAAATVTVGLTGKIRKKDFKKVTIGEPVFWLVRSVTQQADPSVLPYAEQMNARATDAMRDYLIMVARRQAGPIGGTT